MRRDRRNGATGMPAHQQIVIAEGDEGMVATREVKSVYDSCSRQPLRISAHTPAPPAVCRHVKKNRHERT